MFPRKKNDVVERLHTRSGTLSVRLVLHPENRGWILEKFARRLADNLPKWDANADIGDQPSKTADVNHWMLYLHCKPDDDRANTMLITHVDHPRKYFRLRESLRSANAGICLSRTTLEELARRGLDRRKLCFIVPGHDGRTRPSRIHIAITSRVYGDGRKREQFLVRLAGVMRLDAFHFDIVGAGWDAIVPALRAAGATVDYSSGSDDYEADYRLVLERLERCQYYLYLGMDEGSTGLLDALAAGLQTIVTRQGFHLDIEGGITHGFVEFDELLHIFKGLAAEWAARRDGVASLTWAEYARKHALVWQAILSGGQGDMSALLDATTPERAQGSWLRGRASDAAFFAKPVVRRVRRMLMRAKG